jgi:hypothetical protein
MQLFLSFKVNNDRYLSRLQCVFSERYELKNLHKSPCLNGLIGYLNMLQITTNRITIRIDIYFIYANSLQQALFWEQGQ